jgi:hypothetical protein
LQIVGAISVFEYWFVERGWLFEFVLCNKRFALNPDGEGCRYFASMVAGSYCSGVEMTFVVASRRSTRKSCLVINKIREIGLNRYEIELKG